ncbi:MAG TPA: permease, partial [Micromonosporaceae bacterium]|nr:permease [Micromonosporaceae bacterium]
STVGLILVPLAGYTFRDTFAVHPPLAASLGVIGAGAAVVAMGYQAATGLTAPRYAALLAVQGAVPLLAYESIRGPAGWALVFAALAAADAVIGRALAAPPSGSPGLASIGWLRELAWVLHGVAVGAALVYAAVALSTADGVAAAVRAAVTLLLTAGVAVLGATWLRRQPLTDVAAGLMTLAIIASAARVASVALPGQALVLIAGAVAVTGAGVRALPATARRGPQLAASGALALLGVVVGGTALRAGVAPIRAALPVWHADLSGYAGRLTDAVAPAGWQVTVAAVLLTIAAALALPAALRREATVAGVAISALATPAAFGLGWTVTPWLLLVAAAGLGVTGLAAPTARAARTHVVAALVVGGAAAGASLARPELTAGVLTGLALTGAIIGFAGRYVGAGADSAGTAAAGPYPDITTNAALGGAAAALPGAVATGTAAGMPGADTVIVLAATFLAVSATLGYAAIAQVALRRPNPPLALGSTLGALAAAVAAFGAAGATVLDALIAMLLLLGAVLLWLAPSIDAGRRADRWVDGADVAAAAVVAGMIGSLARLAALAVPGTGLTTVAVLVLLVALGVRTMPPHWRPGPALGCGLAGALVTGVAGWAAVRGALRVIVAANPIWHANLADWAATVAPARGYGWQTPASLLLLAIAASVVLPVAARAVIMPGCVGLAVLGAPAALELPWWSPTVLSLGAATVLGVSALATAVPLAGLARASTGAALAGFAIGASLVTPGATAAGLAGTAAAGIVVAAAARVIIATTTGEPAAHLLPVGGMALAAALLALPAAVAAAAAHRGRPVEV